MNRIEEFKKRMSELQLERFGRADPVFTDRFFSLVKGTFGVTTQPSEKPRTSFHPPGSPEWKKFQQWKKDAANKKAREDQEKFQRLIEEEADKKKDPLHDKKSMPKPWTHEEMIRFNDTGQTPADVKHQTHMNEWRKKYLRG